MSQLLKEQIDLKSIKKLAVLINQHAPDFKINHLTQIVNQPEWAERPLKQRIRTVTLALDSGFKQANINHYQACLNYLKPVSVEFSGLFHFIFADYVGCFGTQHFAESMDALALFTENSTAEFAIRIFLNSEPERTKNQLLLWAQSENPHLRRLASEGVRPKLPWAEHLPWIAQNPDWVKPIIECLKVDSSLYVRKSVANLLNDLTKSQADWVLQLFNDWLGNQTLQTASLETAKERVPEIASKATGNPSNTICKETRWIIKHALRTLLKQGHPSALAIIGYAGVEHLTVTDWQLDKRVEIGKQLPLAFRLQTDSQQTLGLLRLEYAVYFLRKQQQPYRKVFKIAEANYLVSEKAFVKQHNFKLISTRTYYSGLHKIELLVNGQVMHAEEFDLID